MRLEVEVNCFENPYQLLDICFLDVPFFWQAVSFFFLSTCGVVWQNKQYRKYCVMFPVVNGFA